MKVTWLDSPRSPDAIPTPSSTSLPIGAVNGPRPSLSSRGDDVEAVRSRLQNTQEDVDKMTTLSSFVDKVSGGLDTGS